MPGHRSRYPTAHDCAIAGMVHWHQPPVRVQVLCAGLVEARNWRLHQAPKPLWRLFWAKDGAGELLESGQRTAVTPDRMVLVPPGLQFRSEHARPFHLLFTQALVQGLERRPQPTIMSCPLDAAATAMLTSVAAACAAADALPDIHLQLSALLLHGLTRPELAWHREIPRSPQIARSLDHLRRNLHRPVPSRELAAVAGMHPSAFGRRFRQETGETPQAWHHRVRLDAAAVALLQSAEPIEVVAVQHGYHDRHHFSRAFARAHGMGPAAYRATVGWV